MTKTKFNEFCYHQCDGLYDPNFPLEDQCTGYKMLRKMVQEQIVPFSIEETKRWESSPTILEMYSAPDIRYLRFLHPVLRKFVIENWGWISELKLEEPKDENIETVQLHESIEDFLKARYTNSFIEVVKRSNIDNLNRVWFESYKKEHYRSNSITFEKIKVQIIEVECEYVFDIPNGYYQLTFYFWYEDELHTLVTTIQS